MKRKLRKNLLIVGAVVTLAVALVVGVALPGVAAPDKALLSESDTLPQVVKGKVVDVDKAKTFFKIELASGEKVDVAVDGDTKYFKAQVPGKSAAVAKQGTGPRRIQAQEMVGEGPDSPKGKPTDKAPGPKRIQAWKKMREGPISLKSWPLDKAPGPKKLSNPGVGKGKLKQPQEGVKKLHSLGEEASFEDIAVGDEVKVRLSSESETLLAEMVVIIKRPAIQYISGTIDAVSGDSITIVTDNPTTLRYDKDTIFTLTGVIAVEPGQSIHAVYDSEEMLLKRVRVNVEGSE